MVSNILRSDYAGSAACADCHPDVYSRWLTSPMRNMTRSVEGAVLKAPFNGEVLDFMGDQATLTRVAGQPHLHLHTATAGDSWYRVTRIIGGTYREDFVGLPVAGPEPGAPVVGDARRELVLPVSWLIFSGELRYKGYSVMSKERPGLRAGPVWRQTCVYCHNTVPGLTAWYDDLRGPGGPGYQASVDARMPPDRAWKWHIDDPAGLSAAVQAELTLLLGRPYVAPESSPTVVLDQAMRTTYARLTSNHFVEQGIGCEACHNGARAHVDDSTVRPTFEIKSPLISVTSADGHPPTRAEWINRTCARCHTVLFSGYPPTWEGGLRDQTPGGSSINSGEARDFLLGGCSSRLDCTACHDPHGKDPPRTVDNSLCLTCHEGLASPTALAAHTHHTPEGAGSICVDCHMPRKNMSLQYALTRYHRIGSPTEPRRVEADRPLECALCHADKSVATLVDTMERWWGHRYDRARLRTLYGDDLNTNVMAATLARGRPHEQVVALMQVSVPLAAVAEILAHPLPLLRFYARRALETRGHPLPIDPHAPATAIRAALERWRASGN